MNVASMQRRGPSSIQVAGVAQAHSYDALFDSHVHLDAVDFDADRDEVIAGAVAAGVRELLIPAVDRAGWPKLHALCASRPGLYPAYGLHPCYLDRHADADVDALADWLHTHPAAAVGECGLDHFETGLDRDRQLRLLRGQLDIAQQFDLPLVLHARRAFEAVILELRRFGKPLRGVVHSFSGSIEQARELWRLGFYAGIGGPVTYERAHRLRQMAAALPEECLLLETDAPDQPGAAYRGQRNVPANLVEVLDCVAALRHVTTAELAHATTANARQLFVRDA